MHRVFYSRFFPVVILRSVNSAQSGMLDRSTLGIALQITVTILAAIMATIGISLSLMSSKWYGVELKDFRKLRKTPSLFWEILTLVICAVIDVVCYVLDWNVLCLVCCTISIGVCIFFLCLELPLMTKDDSVLKRVLLKGILSEDKNRESSFIATTCLLNMLHERTVLYVYKLFQSKDEEKNALITRVLLDSWLRSFETANNKTLEAYADYVFDCLADKKLIIKPNANDLSVAMELLWENNRGAIQHCLEAVLEILSFGMLEEEQSQYIVDVIMRLECWNIRKDNSVIEFLREFYSIHHYEFRDDSITTRLFALLSFYLYYLNVETRSPKELKNRALAFVVETPDSAYKKVSSWRSLYEEFVNSTYSFNWFIGYIENNRHNLELYIEELDAHTVCLDGRLATEWYLANMMLSDCIYDDANYSDIFDGEHTYFVKNILEPFFNTREVFTVPKFAKDVETFFFRGQESNLSFFEYSERENKQLLGYYNKLAKQDCAVHALQARAIDIDGSLKDAQGILTDRIQKDTLFDSSIPIFDGDFLVNIDVEKDFLKDGKAFSSYCFGIITHKFSAILDSLGIETKTRIEDVLVENCLYGNARGVRSLRLSVVNDEREKSVSDWLEKVEEVNSSFLPIAGCFVKVPTFFNCNVELASSAELQKQMIERRIIECGHPSGQLLYKGAFYSQKELEEILNAEWCVVQTKFSFGINGKESIFKVERNLE